jgi:hypothetical protein
MEQISHWEANIRWDNRELGPAILTEAFVVFLSFSNKFRDSASRSPRTRSLTLCEYSQATLKANNLQINGHCPPSMKHKVHYRVHKSLSLVPIHIHILISSSRLFIYD